MEVYSFLQKKKNPKFENLYDYAKLEKLFDLKTGWKLNVPKHSFSNLN